MHPARIVPYGHDDYPPLLREIPHPPAALYLQGILPRPDAPTVAIVGTRRATPSGMAYAEELAQTLSRAGIVVISGLAFGIDGAAHRGAVAAGRGGVAVLANGIGEFHPSAHAGLAGAMLRAGGAVVSEYPPGTPPFQSRFLERNRIVSGLSRGVVVIEAPERSGSLVTARFALEQNRDVFVVPGPARHPNFRGSHALIRAGAELVTGPEDVLASLGVATEPEEAGNDGPAVLDAESRAVLDAVKRSPDGATVDKIISLTHLEARRVQQALTLLFLKGTVRETGDLYTWHPQKHS